MDFKVEDVYRRMLRLKEDGKIPLALEKTYNKAKYFKDVVQPGDFTINELVLIALLSGVGDEESGADNVTELGGEVKLGELTKIPMDNITAGNKVDWLTVEKGTIVIVDTKEDVNRPREGKFIRELDDGLLRINIESDPKTYRDILPKYVRLKNKVHSHIEGSTTLVQGASLLHSGKKE